MDIVFAGKHLGPNGDLVSYQDILSVRCEFRPTNDVGKRVVFCATRTSNTKVLWYGEDSSLEDVCQKFWVEYVRPRIEAAEQWGMWYTQLEGKLYEQVAERHKFVDDVDATGSTAEPDSTEGRDMGATI